MAGDTEIRKDLNTIREFKAELEAEEQAIIQKALQSNDVHSIMDASEHLKDNRKRSFEKKSYLFDPFLFVNNMGYKDKPYNLSYGILRGMAKAPIIKSIITTRVEQVASFSDVEDDAQKIGWRVKKKEKLIFKEKSKSEDLSDQEKREIESIVEFLLNGGEKKRIWMGDSFEQFLRKIVPDSLILDQATFEVIPNRILKPYEFFATDGSTYRLAESFNNEKVDKSKQEAIDGFYPAYVQIYRGTAVSEFYPWELGFGVRNRQTNIFNNGYGVSELEDMIKIVTWMLYSDSYNGKFFSQGSSPKGMFKVTGAIDDGKLQEFRQAWMAQAAGVENAWKIPVLQGADQIDWVDMQKSNNDMEFSKWQEYLIRLSCAMYKIDSSEIGFYLSQGSGGGGGTTYENSQEYKLEYSKDKGLYPLLRFIGSLLNRMIVYPLSDNKYEFEFTGLEPDDEEKGLDLDIKKLNGGLLSWFDIRKKYDLPTYLDPNDFLLNPVWIQWYQMKMQGSMMSNMAMGAESVNPFDPTVGGNDNPFDPSGGMNPFASLDKKTQSQINPFNDLIDNMRQKGENPFAKEFNAFLQKGLK